MQRNEKPVMWETWEGAVEFAYELDRIDTISALEAKFSRCIKRYGFDAFSCSGFLRNTRPFGYKLFVERMPDGYLESYNEECLDKDPTLKVVLHSNKAFLWSEFYTVSRSNRTTNDAVMGHARSFGMKDGIVVPIHRPGTYCGVMSIGSFDTDIERRAMAAVQTMSIFCHDRAYELIDQDVEAIAEDQCNLLSTLTTRERDCVSWVASGKSDWEVGEILGISQSTAHFHIENAKRKLGVRTRVQLVVSAIRAGEIVV